MVCLRQLRPCVMISVAVTLDPKEVNATILDRKTHSPLIKSET